jgi:hypothetical protein
MAMENHVKARQRLRQDEALARARRASATSRGEKARQRDRQMRQMAIEYLRAHPSHGLREAASHIKGYHPARTIGGIMAKIKGAKAEALRSLDTHQPR